MDISPEELQHYLDNLHTLPIKEQREISKILDRL
jgi:hypothetical protein